MRRTQEAYDPGCVDSCNWPTRPTLGCWFGPTTQGSILDIVYDVCRLKLGCERESRSSELRTALGTLDGKGGAVMGIYVETLILSSLHKQGMRLLSALETLFAGQPLYPNFA